MVVVFVCTGRESNRCMSPETESKSVGRLARSFPLGAWLGMKRPRRRWWCCVVFLSLASLVLLVFWRCVVWVYQDPTGQWGPRILPTLPSKHGQSPALRLPKQPKVTEFVAEEVAAVRGTLLDYENPHNRSSRVAEKIGDAYVTRNFEFEGGRFLDAFVAPSFRFGDDDLDGKSDKDDDDSAVLVLAGYSIVHPIDAICVYPNSQQVTHLWLYRREVCVCRVPADELQGLLQHATGGDHQATIPVALHAASGATLVVEASLWPWRLRHQRYKVAHTAMVKDFACRPDHLRAHCVADFILWHRMHGVQHFFIYDNGSDPKHPWLQTVKHFVRLGIVTLIDFPQFLGGPDNNKVQRVQMNHAMFAFSTRVDWLAYFDLDEFLIPSPPNQHLRSPIPHTTTNNNNSTRYTDQSTIWKLATQDAATGILAPSPDAFTILQVPMRNAQHPDTCRPYHHNNSTTRLASCTAYHAGTDGNNKILVRTGRDGPRPLRTPHKGQVRARSFHFVHFAAKYGCRSASSSYDNDDCQVYTDLADWPPVHQLEHQLALLDRETAAVATDGSEDPL